MIGSICALGTALAWASSSIIIKFLTNKVDTLSINMLRLWFGSICLLTLVFFTRRGTDLIDTPILPLIYIIISGIFGLSIGDTLYIKSLSFLDVSRTFPITMCSTSVLTLFFAVFMLGESITCITISGAILVLFGIYLIAGTGKGPHVNPALERLNAKGVILAIMAALGWTIGATGIKLGASGMDTFVTAAVRILSGAIVLSFYTYTKRGIGRLRLSDYGLRGIMLSAVSGILSYGVAGVLFILAIQLIGAGKTVLLAANAPLFMLPLSIFFLEERPTPHAIVGVFICVLGVCLVCI